ncbi:MAG TPA: ABC transporter permease [Candidatus Dormibacteraeota bacterium]|nr:ABC transporter permease [Candidatus Dormibacteraeota bacterium]
MLAYTRFEVARTLRNTRFLVLTMLMPALLYLFFDRVQSGVMNAYLMVAMAGFSMIAAAISANCVTLPAERASGWLRQLRITPLSGPAWVTARIVQATVAVVPGLAVISVAGLLFGHVQLTVEQWAAFVALVLAGSVPFSFVGLLLGQLLDAQAAQPVQGMLTMLLSFGGGLFIPLAAFPEPLRTAAGVLPTRLLYQSGQDVMAAHLPAAADLAGLLAWAVAMAALALAIWSRQDGRRLAV